jgi:hypothetical protein
MKRALFGIAIVASGLTTFAQQEPTFRTRTDVVAIDVSAMNGKKPVTTLTKDDFRLTDDGVAQTLLDVGREQMPLDVTLTIDVSGSVTPAKRAAIERAVRQVTETLHPDDRCSVVSFGAHIAEESAMNHPPVGLSLSNTGIGGTSFLDALLLSLVTAPSIGRRQLNLFLTDGLDTSSFFNISLVRDTLQFSNGQTSIILVRGGGGNLGDGPVMDLLKTVTATGGGQIVEMDKDDQLKDRFLAALDEFRTSYLLRYAPTGVPRQGWHPVVVTVAKGKPTIRARQGYWSGSAGR